MYTADAEAHITEVVISIRERLRYSGNELLDELIESSSSVLFYGVAGAGKTSLLLTIAGNLCSAYSCVYITTEETTHYEHIARNPDRYKHALFTEAYDLSTLVKVTYAVFILRPRYIFVDSLNAPFRLEALKENALAKYGFATSLLLSTAEASGGKLFASAQVRAGETGDLEITGFKLLDFYFDAILGVFIESAGIRFIKPLKTLFATKFEKLYFRITDEGVKWLDRT
ncbi:MAG: AAA family ATPase [Desulfurococcaceae archaeon]